MAPNTARASPTIIKAVLGRLGFSVVGTPTLVPHSVRNDNFRVQTVSRALFVRLHRRTRSRERIALNLAALHHAAESHLPVAAPLADGKGEVLFEEAEQLVSVYPWVEGTTLSADAIGVREAVLLGATHGRLHLALATFRHPSLRTASELAWDRERSLNELRQVEALLASVPPDEETLVPFQVSRE